MNIKIKSVAIIMDGNRRWAVENGMSKIEGHKYGAEKISEVIDWVLEEDIKNIVLYAFSTENWNRSKIEIDAIMFLFEDFIKNKLNKIIEKKVSIKFIGKLDMFSKKLQILMSEVEEKSKGFETVLFMAMSYGGRVEIIEGIKRLSQEKTKEDIESLTEGEFERYLWTSELDDPEIIIRTGGDRRLSNFLLWKSSYSELIFTDTKWPAFSEREFKKILKDYQKVKINKGK